VTSVSTAMAVMVRSRASSDARNSSRWKLIERPRGHLTSRISLRTYDFRGCRNS
jgi:hypothetical protein